MCVCVYFFFLNMKCLFFSFDIVILRCITYSEKPDDSLNCNELPSGDPVGNNMNGRCAKSRHDDLSHCDIGGPQSHKVSYL